MACTPGHPIAPSTRPPAYAIHPVSTPAQDAADLAETMMRAFYRDPHWASLWKPPATLDDIIRDCERRLPRNLVTGRAKRHQKAVETATGKAVGYARWILPGGAAAGEAGEEAWAAAAVPAVDEATRQHFEQLFESVTDDGSIRNLDGAMVEELSVAIEAAEERVRGRGDDFLTLDYLATHPDHQRRGVGSMLLQSGLAYADAQSLKVLVVAKTPGVRLYQDHGFRVVEVVEQQRPQYGWSEPYTSTILVRHPKT
ncbi:acyl-n-acyltransferase [Diplodia corticola]|uniref:Acyl-n-acyltransferase n=1 Tax=Diplodia corticola TaxID=236234 RepID=A0A1J9RNN1_9PEZI|nr:acyl-n-acyltransferase [Diplodia corticola]OJD34155.1 acyl-n-acyltransferase [Diplodia corticola]